MPALFAKILLEEQGFKINQFSEELANIAK